jgi:hypothetical protein
MNKDNTDSNRDQWRPNNEERPPNRSVSIDEARLDLSNQIARRAYRLYLEGGAQHGHDLGHWLKAEAELFAERAALRADQPPLITDVPKQGSKPRQGIVL